MDSSLPTSGRCVMNCSQLLRIVRGTVRGMGISPRRSQNPPLLLISASAGFGLLAYVAVLFTDGFVTSAALRAAGRYFGPLAITCSSYCDVAAGKATICRHGLRRGTRNNVPTKAVPAVQGAEKACTVGLDLAGDKTVRLVVRRMRC